MTCFRVSLAHRVQLTALLVFFQSGGATTRTASASLLNVTRLAGCGVTDKTGDAPAEDAQVECLFDKWYPSLTPDAIDMGQAGIYGEITPAGVDAVFSTVAALGAGAISSEDNFYDLGSGLGKMVLQACLATDVARAVGVELDKERHNLAVAAHQKFRAIREEDASRAGFVQGDIRDVTIWANATVIYASSLCFPAALMLEFTVLLATALQPGTVVFSLVALPGCHRGLRSLGSIQASMTWTKSFEVHVYMVPPLVGRPPTWAKLGDEGLREAETRSVLQKALHDGMFRTQSCAASLLAQQQHSDLPSVAARRACAAVALQDMGCAGPRGEEGRPLNLLAALTAVRLDDAVTSNMHMIRGCYASAAQCLLADLEALTNLAISDEDEVRLDKVLLGSGTGMDALGEAGATVLHEALRLAREPEPRLLQHILQRRADVQVRDRAGKIPLSLAAQRGHTPTVLALFKAGAIANSSDTDTAGAAPLHQAVRQLRVDVIKALLDHRAFVDARDAEGSTPLHNMRTARSGRSEAEQVQAVELLLAARADPNAADGTGKRLLQHMAMKGEIHLVEVLMQSGADVNMGDRFGNTPLLGTAIQSRVDVAKRLLEGRAKVDAIGAGGGTALARSVFFGHVDMASLLLEFGASPLLPDTSGVSPLKHAEAAGNTALVEVLQRFTSNEL